MHVVSNPVDPPILQGMIPLQGTLLHVLFDTGTSRSFISSHIVRLLELIVKPLYPPMSIDIPTGEVVRVDSICPGCTIMIAKHSFIYEFIVFNLETYDLILGMD